MKTRDEEIGEVIRRARGGTSQDALADAMKARGHDKWSQSTVWAIEKGNRPLRLTEAEDIAATLGLASVVELLREPHVAKLIRALRANLDTIERLAHEIRALLRELHNAQSRLRVQLDDPALPDVPELADRINWAWHLAPADWIPHQTSGRSSEPPPPTQRRAAGDVEVADGG